MSAGAAAAEPSGSSPGVLVYPRGSVLLVAGIPGAGKSTLINRVFLAPSRPGPTGTAGAAGAANTATAEGAGNARTSENAKYGRNARYGGTTTSTGNAQYTGDGGSATSTGGRAARSWEAGPTARAGCAGPGTVVLDSADIRARLAHRLGPRVPYAVYRPVVHTVHYARIATMTLGPERNLVVHECGTRNWARRTLAILARLRGRPAHLLLLDASPAHALAGQHSRGRVIRARAFGRHERAWLRLRSAGPGRHPLHREGWASVRCVSRREAAAITEIRFD